MEGKAAVKGQCALAKDASVESLLLRKDLGFGHGIASLDGQVVLGKDFIEFCVRGGVIASGNRRIFQGQRFGRRVIADLAVAVNVALIGGCDASVAYPYVIVGDIARFDRDVVGDTRKVLQNNIAVVFLEERALRRGDPVVVQDQFMEVIIVFSRYLMFCLSDSDSDNTPLSTRTLPDPLFC